MRTTLLPVQNPTRTILGAPQTQYLKDQLSAGQGSQTWKVLGQQVCFQLLPTQQIWHKRVPACILHAGPCACIVLHSKGSGTVVHLHCACNAGSVHPPVRGRHTASVCSTFLFLNVGSVLLCQTVRQDPCCTVLMGLMMCCSCDSPSADQ